VRAQAAGTAFSLAGCGLQREVQIATLGEYNVSNWLACLGSLIGAGFDANRACDALLDVRSVEGRMQLIGGSEDAPLVVVDYAHTPDALAKVLKALRPVAQVRGGKLVAVFGCGGNRDPGKRPQMAAIAASEADVAVLTSDNPRNEDPQAILADMHAGLAPDANAWSEVDRRAAIHRAIAQASGRDVIVIAGKGHERTQEIAGVKHPFYDPDEARSALAERTRQEVRTC
jgi:UDP-N-acetylmuramoyl-L-alanyl-D-glutamate--2,6-diaminopimelate ligase